MIDRSNIDQIGNKLSRWINEQKPEPYSNLSPIDQVVIEINCIDRLKAEVDHANAHVLRSFKVNLVMDDDDLY
jgi:hypothetical protein